MTDQCTPMLQHTPKSVWLPGLVLTLTLVALLGVACGGAEPPGQTVFRATLGSLEMGPNGDIELVGVSLQPGERYVIYLTQGGDCRVLCHLSRERREGEGAEIVTGSGDRLRNEMESFEVYGGSSGWFHSVAVFTSPADPPGRLVLRFRDVVAMGAGLSTTQTSAERYLFTLEFEDLLAADPDKVAFEVRMVTAAQSQAQ